MSSTGKRWEGWKGFPLICSEKKSKEQELGCLTVSVGRKLCAWPYVLLTCTQGHGTAGTSRFCTSQPAEFSCYCCCPATYLLETCGNSKDGLCLLFMWVQILQKPAFWCNSAALYAARDWDCGAVGSGGSPLSNWTWQHLISKYYWISEGLLFFSQQDKTAKC